MKINGREVLQGRSVGGGYPRQDYPVFRIAQAIVEQAVKDYIRLYKKVAACGATVVIQTMEGGATADNTALDFRTACLLSSLHELESFFMSQWFEALSDCDPARLMRLCRELAKKQIAEKQSRAKQKTRDKLPDANAAARTPRSRQSQRHAPLSSPRRDPRRNPRRTPLSAPYTPATRHREAEWMDWGGGVGGVGRRGGVGGTTITAAKRRSSHEVAI